MTTFLLQKVGGQKVQSPFGSIFSSVDDERTTPVAFVLMRADGAYVKPVGQFEDEQLGLRVVALLNREGVEDVPLEMPALDVPVRSLEEGS